MDVNAFEIEFHKYFTNNKQKIKNFNSFGGTILRKSDPNKFNDMYLKFNENMQYENSHEFDSISNQYSYNQWKFTPILKKSLRNESTTNTDIKRMLNNILQEG